VSVLDLCKLKYTDIGLYISRYDDEFDINHMSNRFFEVFDFKKWNILYKFSMSFPIK
jgi:hypothetical protein